MMTTNSLVSERRTQRHIVVSTKMTEESLQALNVRVKVDGYQSVGQMLRDYAAYKFHRYSKDDQVEKLLDRIKNKNIKDPPSRSALRCTNS